MACVQEAVPLHVGYVGGPDRVDEVSLVVVIHDVHAGSPFREVG